MSPGPERFTSRLGMMLAMLGMAVGTGNIWRFPRIAGQNGGGEFLIAWVAFLFLWSIPLFLLEFGMGRRVRSGAIKAFATMMGPRYAWLGAFTVFVITAITCYYSIVAGWTFRFTFASITGEIPESRPGTFWADFNGSAWPALTHALAIGTATFVVARGVALIETVAKVLMPTLVILVLLLAVRAVTLPGASDGLEFLFSVDWAELGNGRLWVEALAQNAWDTGAGTGLVLCYAAYMREGEDTVQNAFVLPAANNAISLTAGILVMCTVFSVVPQLVSSLGDDPEALAAYPALSAAVSAGAELTPELVQETIFQSNNEGLTFVWMPQLFGTLPFGRWLMVLFFVALSFAAITSLIAMVELTTRAFVDAGVDRARAARGAGAGIFVLGLPSVFLPSFLGNQDWVWGVALILSGLFFAIAVIVYGVHRFREAELNHDTSHMTVGPWWNIAIGIFVPVQAIVLLGWTLLQARERDPEGWLDPFGVSNVGTVIFQFAIVLSALFVANRWIAPRSLPSDSTPKA